MKLRLSTLPLFLCFALTAVARGGGPVVVESARKIPVAYQVDVVVVGGSTGAVSAALAAAKNGAKVFLAAPHPYLGEDMTATLRLWLEEGERPTSQLATKLFATQRGQSAELGNVLPFDYGADLPSAGVHKDTKPPSRLCDGKWASAVSESVQYNGDVNITVDLTKKQRLKKAYAMAYHTKDFLVESVTVYSSEDKKDWKEVAVVRNDRPDQRSVNVDALALSAPVTEETRYLRFFIKKAAGSTRVLVGEIVLIGADAPSPARTKPRVPPVRPLHVKRTLDEALLEAGVQFLYSCYATDVLRDGQGNPCGIVMANRAGRQAVVAKAVIDATNRAWVARMAGAKFRPFPAGPQTVKRVVVGGKVRSGKNMTARTIHPPFTGTRRGRGKTLARRYPIVEYTLRIPMRDGGYASWAKAEQLARDMTYHPDQQFTSDVLFQVPPDRMKGVGAASGEWRGVEKLPLEAFRPAGVLHLFVLGGCADIPREQAEKLMRPLALIDMGARIGAAAAAQAKELPAPKNVRLPGAKAKAVASGDVREVLRGVRPVQELPTIPQEERPLPVLGRYDVVVIGGGTSGAPAGIAAARQGARTLVVEYLHGLGGVGTLGAIAGYYWGNRVGFTREVLGGKGRWSIEEKMEWWRKALRQAGADIWFGALGCGAFVVGGRVAGAVVATPEGRGVVLAKVVIDATGNADIAAAAGAPCIYTDASDIALQGTGLPPRRLGASYTNTDFTIVDETDMMDVWHVLLYAKLTAGNAFDLGQLIDTRERRRIVGDFTITILDQVLGRTHRDTVVQARSDFDTHGYTTDPYFALQHPPHGKGYITNIPYRAMLPEGLDGILVVGLGISAHRDAVPLIRMQPDIENGGYAAGVAAATAAKVGGRTRKIDVRALQRDLVKIGNLKKSVLTDKESFPLPPKKISKAVYSVRDNYKGVAIVLAHPNQALPLLRKAYAAAAAGEHKLIYAHILGVLGDARALPTLIAAVEAAPKLDKGWRYRGMGQYGRNMSHLDSLIYAMGCTRDRRATASILKKLKLLEPNDAFSHFRAMALALERLGDPAAASPLAELLARPGVRGHAISTADRALERARRWRSWTATAPRSNAIRELMLARALFRCGDKDGLGKKILEEYTKDLRGHLARHAQAVLEAGGK